MTPLIFKVIGYLAWLTTLVLGIAGSWFWHFTEPDHEDPERKRLTRPGRIAVYVMALSALCAVLSTTYSEIASYSSAKREKASKEELRKALQSAEQERNLLQSKIGLYGTPHTFAVYRIKQI